MNAYKTICDTFGIDCADSVALEFNSDGTHEVVVMITEGGVVTRNLSATALHAIINKLDVALSQKRGPSEVK